MLCDPIYLSRTFLQYCGIVGSGPVKNVLEYKTPSVSTEIENNVLTITGPIPLTTACFEFQDKGDVKNFTAHFPQSTEGGNEGYLMFSINMWSTVKSKAHLFIAREQKSRTGCNPRAKPYPHQANPT